MRTTANEQSVMAAATALESDDLRSPASFHQAYRELPERSSVEADVLEQLKANMLQLDDLHSRLRFAMSEISYLLKKN